MKRRLTFELYVIIIRESPFPKYLEIEVEKTASEPKLATFV